MTTFSVGDAVTCIAKTSIYRGCNGLVEAVTDNHAPFCGPAVRVCFVMQGTVWVKPEHIEMLTAPAVVARLKTRQEEFTAKRRQRGYY